MKVFIVDDSEILRERIRSILSDIKRVEIIGEAENALQARTFLKSHTPDVVILDVRMPGGSGIELLEKIKKEQPAIKVIVLTNYPYPQYRKRCLELGAEYFLDKSTEFDRLSEIFQGFIQRPSGNGKKPKRP